MKIDREGSTQEKKELIEGQWRKRNNRYWAAVEAAARGFHAVQPLTWQGDGVMIYLTDDEGTPAPVRGFQLAKNLWEEVCVSLGLQARIAVSSATVEWEPETGKMSHQAIDLCGHLEQATPSNSVAVTEDVYLMLPERERPEHFPCLGLSEKDHVVAYVFPPAARERADPEKFLPDKDLKYWDKFRYYSNSPEIKNLRYVGFRLTRKEPPVLGLLDVFVSPHIKQAEKESTTDGIIPFDRPSSEAAKTDVEAGKVLSPLLTRDLAEALRVNRRIVLLGEPGSGKTTVLRWLAVVSSEGRIGLDRQLGFSERLLPLPVSVGHLAEMRNSMTGSPSVPDAMARYFHERNVGQEDELRTFLHRSLEQGECLVLLDGLDEVKTENRHATRAWLETFITAYPRNRFIISSRTVGYSGFEMNDKAEIYLDSFDDRQVETYVRAFTRAYRKWEIGGDDPMALRDADKLLSRLRENPRLSEVARNPFALSALALIHRAEGDLPHHRVLAYEIFSRALCETWETARRLVSGHVSGRPIPYAEQAVPVLGHLALNLHREWPTGAAPKEFVIDVLAEKIREREKLSKAEARRVAAVFLDKAGEEVQILIERGPGQWGFMHLEFQEFFAAVGLHAEGNFESEVLQHLHDPRWQEVIRLGTGYMGHVQNRQEDARNLVEHFMNLRQGGRRNWITKILHKQDVLAVLLGAEVTEALPQDLRATIATNFVKTFPRIPFQVWKWALREVRHSGLHGEISRALVKMRRGQVWWPDEDPIEALITKLHGGDPPLSWLAGTELGRRKTPETEKILIEALQSRDDTVRASAINGLTWARSARAKEEVFKAINDNSPVVRFTSTLVLGLFRSAQSIRTLLNILSDDSNPKVRSAAAQALAQLGNPDALGPLEERFKRESDGDTRREVAFALARIGGSDAERILLDASQDRRPEIRAPAILALAGMRSPQAKDALLKALMDGSPDVKRAGTLGVSAARMFDAVPRLLKMLTQESDPRVRAPAAMALGEIGDRKGLRPLLAALLDKNVEVRRSAAIAVGRLGQEEGVQPLLRLLKKRTPRSLDGAAAIEALWSISDSLPPSPSARRAIKKKRKIRHS
ncbi:MAG: HEAT repeat domain-containing protein [Nitrospirae bacterium]|nr:HEAT repeat domain-containing protein [Nitrospirota bacterium]